MKNIRFLRITTLLALLPLSAHMYVDPGAGMLLAQGSIALVVAIIVCVQNPIASVEALIIWLRKIPSDESRRRRTVYFVALMRPCPPLNFESRGLIRARVDWALSSLYQDAQTPGSIGLAVITLLSVVLSVLVPPVLLLPPKLSELALQAQTVTIAVYSSNRPSGLCRSFPLSWTSFTRLASCLALRYWPSRRWLSCRQSIGHAHKKALIDGGLLSVAPRCLGCKR